MHTHIHVPLLHLCVCLQPFPVGQQHQNGQQPQHGQQQQQQYTQAGPADAVAMEVAKPQGVLIDVRAPALCAHVCAGGCGRLCGRISRVQLSWCMSRAGQNHIYTVHIRCLENH